MKKSLALAALIFLSVLGCKKEQPTPTPMPTANSKQTPVIDDTHATSRESPSGAAAVTPPIATQPSGH